MKQYKLPPKVRVDAKGVGLPKNITAQLDFEDGYRLDVICRRDREYCATKLDSVVLSKAGGLMAKLAGTKGPQVENRRYDMEFWGRDGLEQSELVEYWNAAINLAEKRMDRYLKGGMSDDNWAKPENYAFLVLVATHGWERYILSQGLARKHALGYRNEESTFVLDDLESIKGEVLYLESRLSRKKPGKARI